MGVDPEERKEVIAMEIEQGKEPEATNLFFLDQAKDLKKMMKKMKQN